MWGIGCKSMQILTNLPSELCATFCTVSSIRDILLLEWGGGRECKRI